MNDNKNDRGRFSRTHGMSGTPTYLSWYSMKQRCLNARSTSYQRYGGAGIKICMRWHKFGNFLKDMGKRPSGKQLDRYPNASGNYSPKNCRWATDKENQNNRTNTIYIKYKGRRIPITYAAEEIGISRSTLATRLLAGWSHKRIMETPSLRNY